ncbi:MAG TPA: hypothetical protein VLG47_03425 [Candidatus Saccharimonadales bacterium]|nr:hypothetical protein [Candidatus Saccharimonadales bacterium]
MARAKNKVAHKKAARSKVSKGKHDPVSAPSDTVKAQAKQDNQKVSSEQSAANVSKNQIASAPKLFIRSGRVLIKDWKLFSIIMLFYALAYALLVGGLSSSSLTSLKAALVSGHFDNWSTSRSLYTTLLSAGNNGVTAAGAFETILLIFISLILIWALRQRMAGHEIRARDAFYKGTYPFVPFILVLLVIGLQLLPLVLGGGIFGAVVLGGIAKGFLEIAAATVLSIVLIGLSLYWVCSSLMALYIVTLPDLTPVDSLRSAKKLVHKRRLPVIRKILFLPLVVIVASFVLLLPMARYATPIAVAAFFVFTMVAISMIHSYMYGLYRELL